MNLAAAALALFIENLVGYPQQLQRHIGHPVEWIGRLITALELRFNTAPADPRTGRLNGMTILLLLLAVAIVPTVILQLLLSHLPYGWLVNALLATTLLAQKSLRDHVTAVFNSLGQSLEAARGDVAKIVGRDPSNLDESGIAKAALESLAENTSDGIVAPAIYYALFGLPGLAAYKAINTADSMIGHKSDRYLHFGWAAARCDDLVNLPASRLTALLFTSAAGFTSRIQANAAWRAAWRDASKHNSPNAGWPEAAMAGALGLRFGGPRNYDGESVDLPWMGDGSMTLTRQDIQRGLDLYDRSTLLLAAVFLALAFFL